MKTTLAMNFSILKFMISLMICNKLWLKIDWINEWYIIYISIFATYMYVFK